LAHGGSADNAYKFASEQFDEESNLYYLRARHYSPETGRFFSIDPFAGSKTDPISLHRYQYARQNPVNYGDPTGLSGDFSLASLSTAFAINGGVAAAIAYAQGKSPGQIVAAGLVSGVLGAAGGVVGGIAAKGLTGILGKTLANPASGVFVTKLLGVFMKAPALLLPGMIAASKAAVGTMAFVLEKRTLSEPLSAQGAAGFFVFNFTFEFAFATMGVNAAGAQGAAIARQKLSAILEREMGKDVGAINFKLAIKAKDEMSNLDLLSGFGLFGAYMNAGVFNLSKGVVKEIMITTTEVIGANIPGLPGIYEAIVEVGEELFN
jgi:RHS repeat-associated protein